MILEGAQRLSSALCILMNLFQPLLESFVCDAKALFCYIKDKNCDNNPKNSSMLAQVSSKLSGVIH